MKSSKERKYVFGAKKDLLERVNYLGQAYALGTRAFEEDEAARDEIGRLKVVYETVQDSNAKQNDVFLLGDFNTNVDKKEWESLKSLPGMKHILTSSNVTTLYKARGRLSKNQYDTIWYQAEYSDEDIIAETAEVHEAWRESIDMPDDVKLPGSIRSDENKKIWLYGKYVSDHLPVVAELEL